MTIAYVTLGTNDIDRALAFYDALFAEIGGRRLMQLPDDRMLTTYGVGAGPMLAVGKPYDGAPASVGNGTMLALAMDSREQVARVHAAAVRLGAADDGAPGPRGPEEMNLYAAYFRDPDGNKICVIRMG